MTDRGYLCRIRYLSGLRRAAKVCMWQYACKGAEACTMMCQVCLSSYKQCCHSSITALYLEVYVSELFHHAFHARKYIRKRSANWSRLTEQEALAQHCKHLPRSGGPLLKIPPRNVARIVVHKFVAWGRGDGCH
jgi:hypothetical protein